MASSRVGAAAKAGRQPLIVSLVLAGVVLAGVSATRFGSNPFAASGQETGTAFASAPPGAYLVLASTEPEGVEDTITVVSPADPAAPMEIARVAHLPGYPSRGAVSPDGTMVALVVAEAGTLTRPGAAIIVVDLRTAAQTRIAVDVDVLQDPAWSPGSTAVAFTRTVVDDETGIADVELFEAAVDASAESLLARAENVLGAYVVAYTPAAELVWVAIGQGGSVAHKGSAAVATLGPGITRDWALSPDGLALAYISVSTDSGVRYEPHVALLDGGGATAAGAGGQQAVGAAWKPGLSEPLFGFEPGVGAAAEDGPSGFDVPHAWSADGSAVAVENWTGPSFAEPGTPSLQVVTAAGRATLDGYRSFYGWAQR